MYGLTKGQFRRTRPRLEVEEGRAELGLSIDLVAIRAATRRHLRRAQFFGARARLCRDQGAIQHRGAAFIDVISPCIAQQSCGLDKSFDYCA